MKPLSLFTVGLGLIVSLALTGCGEGTHGIGGFGSKTLGFAWPPEVGQPYPDLQLLDASGETVQLSDYRGKVLLIEPIGMT